MVSPHLELPTLASAVNNLPTLMDDQTNLLDQALQGDIDYSVAAGGTIVIAKSDSLRNFLFNLTDSPGADFNLDFPTNNRYFMISNKSGKIATIRIDGGGGQTVTVFDTEKRILYIDGTDVIDVTGIGVPNEETLVTLATDFVISSTTLTAIDWGLETRDEGAWWAISPDPEQIKMGQGIFDAIAKIHIINLVADDTVSFKLQRYNSSDVLQETLAEDHRKHDVSVDTVVTLSAINIRGIVGDYLTVEVKSSTDTGYSVEADDSYFLVRTSTSGGSGSAGGGGSFIAGSSFCILAGKVESFTHNANKVAVWTEVEDTDGYFGGGTVADEQWEFPFTGRYRITTKIALAAATTTDFIIQVVGRKNRGATTSFDDDFTDFRHDDRRSSVSSSVRRDVTLQGLVDVLAADEMDLLFFHFGATRNFIAAAFVHIEYLGPTPV